MKCTCKATCINSTVNSNTFNAKGHQKFVPLCSQVSIKCPWKQRESFMKSRQIAFKKRKLVLDPIDPEFTDHFTPGNNSPSGQKIEAEEIIKIQVEIKRIRTKNSHFEYLRMLDGWSDKTLRESIKDYIRKAYKIEETIKPVQESKREVKQTTCDKILSDQYEVPLDIEPGKESMSKSNEHQPLDFLHSKENIKFRKGSLDYGRGKRVPNRQNAKKRSYSFD